MMKSAQDRENQFRFFATVSDRGQIFIPKPLQNYFRIRSRDKVAFIVEENGKVVFTKRTERTPR